MTLDDAIHCYPTTDLVLPKHKFYPVKIPNGHRQLRHYISSPDPNLVYYTSGLCIYALRLKTAERQLLATLSYTPKCLTAGLDYIVVGSEEHGDISWVKLRDGLRPSGTNDDRDVDSLLSLDLMEQRSAQARGRGPGARTTREGCLQVHNHRMGGSIVNSVSLHRLKSGAAHVMDEDVVVISNNDKTVKIFSLTRHKTLISIEHSVCMNYATLSPDGSILAAVGDENSAYFYNIRSTVTESLYSHENYFWKWDCQELMVPRLKLSSPFDDGCCFTVAFSPSSHLCAVASQTGIITIFDAKRILASRHASSCAMGGPVICRLQSTRSFSDGGAVRSMAFAPTPLDLLVWVEEFGRVAIVDIRQMMARTQTLELNLRPSENMERLNVTEYSLGETNSTDTSDRERETSPEWRRSEHDRISSLMDYIDDSHDTPRNRRYTPMRRNPGRNSGDGNDEENPTHPPESSMYNRHRDPTFRDYIRERSRIGDRTSFQPRRRRSQILSDDNSRQTSLEALEERTRTIWEGAAPFLDNTGRAAAEAMARRRAEAEEDIIRRRTELEAANAPHNGTGASSGGQGRAYISALYASVVSASPDEEETSRNETTHPPTTNVNPSTTTRRPPGAIREENSAGLTLAEFSTAERAEIMREVLAERRRRQRQYQEGTGTGTGTGAGPGTGTGTGTWATPPPDASTSNNAPTSTNESSERDALRDQLSLEQARSLRLRQMLEVMERSRASAPDRNIGLGESSADVVSGGRQGVGTAGIGWSRNGRDLYIGTEEGIFEYKINIEDRSCMPAYDFR